MREARFLVAVSAVAIVATGVAPAMGTAASGSGGDARGGAERAGGPSGKAAATVNVTVRDFEFAPQAVTIDPGDTVTWTNQGPTAHTATADNDSFDTDLIQPGQNASHTFENSGTFTYFCRPHPFMTAGVTVRGDAAQTEDTDDSEGAADDEDDDTAASSPGTSTAGTGTSGSPVASSGSAGSGSGRRLAATGRETLLVAALGGALLALGLGLRRRLSREHP